MPGNNSLVSVKKVQSLVVFRNQLAATRTTLVFLLALFLSGCGGGSANSNAPPPGGVASVTVSPATATIAVRQTQQFTAVAKDSIGTVISGLSFTWSSDAASVTTVDTTGL